MSSRAFGMPAGVSTASLALKADKADLALNVKDYGAVGDGTTDDRAAIQATVDAASAAGGGTVHFPIGTYRVATAITLKSNVNLAGVSANKSRLNATLGLFTWSTGTRFLTVEGLYLYATNGPLFTGSAYLSRAVIRRCTLQGVANDQPMISMTGSADWIGNLVEDCDLHRPAGATVPGVYVATNTGGSNCNIFRNLWVFSNNNTGAPVFHLESTANGNWIYDNRLEDITGEQNPGGLVHAYSVHGLTISNCASWDASVDYTADLIKVGKSSATGSLASRKVRVSGPSRHGGTLAGGVYDVNLVPGSVRHGIVEHVGHSTATPALNLATDTIRLHAGTATAQFGTGLMPFNVKNYGAAGDGVTDDTAALHATYAAATAVKGVVVFPPGVYVVTGTFALSGYSCSTVGSGAHFASGAAAGTVIKAVSQTGPVMDFTGFVLPSDMRGRLTVLADLAVAGDGTADATLAKSGVRIDAMSSALFRDLVISDTGGPCLDLTPTTSGNACYLSDFERLTLVTPVSAKANDVPYMRAVEPNGNRFRGFGIRSVSASADVGASGAVVISDGATFTGSQNLFDAWWWEFLHVPTNGCLFSLQANRNTIRDMQIFDCFKESGATGTAFYRIRPPTNFDHGGNLIQGQIPGRGLGATEIDDGVVLTQSRNTVQGVKGYRGFNVTLASGVGFTTVHLTGGQSGATDIGWVDNSGQGTNHLSDEYAQIEVKPAGFGRDPQLLTSGEVLWDRRLMVAGNLAIVSGTMMLMYFTAQRTETVTTVKVVSAGTAAGATPTLARLGVYEVASNGNLTLIASTASNTGLFAAQHTAYSEALSAPWVKVAGTRYAVGLLMVSGAAMPIVYGATPQSSANVVDNSFAVSPRLTGQVTGQTDLPGSVTSGSVAATRRTTYMELLP